MLPLLLFWLHSFQERITLIAVVITEVTMNTTANPINISQCLSSVLVVLCSLTVSLLSLTA